MAEKKKNTCPGNHPCAPQSKNPHLRGKLIEPLPVAGDNTVAAFIENIFGASGYNARRLAEACDIYGRMLQEDTTVALTLAGAMTPIGMSGPIIELIKKGFVDLIISTGANVYHDLHRAFDLPMVQGHFDADDTELNEYGVARIYDTYIGDDETLLPTDKFIFNTIVEATWNGPQSTASLHNILGKAVLAKADHPEKSFLAAAAKYDVPVFTSSPADSSIGMNLVVPWLFNHGPELSPALDIIESTAVVRAAKKNGVIIVGGGSPKNFYMQTQPTLWQILYDNHGGHDYFIQLTTDTPQWGGLSGATPQEAKSWGKVKDPQVNTTVVYSCASITFPLLTKYALSTQKPKKRKNLMCEMPRLVDDLKQSTKKNKQFQKVYAKLIQK
jgi:deoxyhypusine synthase